MGIPVSCEVDIYGCLSEFINTAVSDDIVTLLDINNSVPDDMFKESIEGRFGYECRKCGRRSITFILTHLWASTVEIPVQKKLAKLLNEISEDYGRSLPVEVTQERLKVTLLLAI